MVKFVDYRDFFKFNKELFEDDYNPGQALVAKTKIGSTTDKSFEISNTTKIGNPDPEHKISNLQNELKYKFNVDKDTTGEGIVKSDGTMTLELKANMQKFSSAFEGWKAISHYSFAALPKGTFNYWNFGVHAKLSPDFYFKVLFDACQLGKVSAEGACQIGERTLVGDSGEFDLRTQKCISYEAGLVHEPKAGALLGLRHRFNTKGSGLPKLGSSCFMAQQSTQSRLLGVEVTWDHSSCDTAARMAFSHKFDELTYGKMRISHEGAVDGVLKHKISDNLTASFTSGISMVDFSLGKTAPFPFGV